MPARTLENTLIELRRLAPPGQRRSQRQPDATPLLIRLLSSCRTAAVEPRVNGIAFRLRCAEAGAPAFTITCVLHDPDGAALLTTAERAVGELLCEGRTLAQIARLRGVSINTVKSQVRQLFRRLDVGSRVALVRRLCP